MNQAREAHDRRILKLAREGRAREACGLLAEAYGAELLGACIARLGDRALAQDAAQDSLARAMVGLSSYRGSGGLRPWLHRIASNRCIDLLRSRTSRQRKLMGETALRDVAADSEAMPSEALEAERDRSRRLRAIREALSRIKEPDRTWVELHHTHDVSYEEIAEEAGLSRAAVKQRIWRAIKRVRATLLAQGEE